MKTKLIFSGDWQCAVTNLTQCEQHVRQICDLFDNAPLNCDRFFIHTGDVKEITNPVDQRVTNFILDAFKRIRGRCDGMAFVAGNHDFITTQDGVPSCVPVVKASGVDWAVSDQWMSCTVGSLAYLFLVPYMRDSDRQKKALAQAAKSADGVKGWKKILVFHNTIDGCRLNNSFKGVGIAKSSLYPDSYDLCVGGHIHKPQFIPPNIHYVGSPFPQDWSEVNTQHRILVVNL